MVYMRELKTAKVHYVKRKRKWGLLKWWGIWYLTEPKAENIPKFFEQLKISMTSSQVFCSLWSFFIDPPFPKTCCSDFDVWWSPLTQSSVITDLLYVGQLESLWHDCKSSQVLNWCVLRQSTHFLFPAFSSSASSLLPQVLPNRLQDSGPSFLRSWSQPPFLQVWSGSWRSYLCLHWAGEQTLVRKWDKSSGIYIYSSNVFL